MYINIDQALGVNIVLNSEIAIDGGGVSIGGGGISMGGGDMSMGGGDASMDIGNGTTSGGGVDGLLANWGFVGGITAGVLALSIIVGILLAKKRIKKGIDPYEN